VDHDGQVRVSHRDGRQERITIDTTDAYRRSWQAALAHFTERLVSGEPFETSGAENLNTLRLVVAAYDSAATHQVIAITDH
jgi:D-apiose dehydrogenase